MNVLRDEQATQRIRCVEIIGQEESAFVPGRGEGGPLVSEEAGESNTGEPWNGQAMIKKRKLGCDLFKEPGKKIVH